MRPSASGILGASLDLNLIPPSGESSTALVAGAVTWITRVRSSSIAVPGILVLSDAQLKELGGLMALIQSRYPVDRQDYPAPALAKEC